MTRARRAGLLVLLVGVLACTAARGQHARGAAGDDQDVPTDPRKDGGDAAATRTRGAAIGVAEEVEEAEPEGDPEPMVDEGEQSKRDEALAKDLAHIEQLQAEGQLNDTAAKQLTVEAAIVPEAPAAKLWAGDADVAPTGPCQVDIKRFCRRVMPGEGRLSACLTAQLEAQASGDAEGMVRVTRACRVELRAFKADRATNVNKDVPLALACRKDIRRFCRPKGRTQGWDAGAIMDCLRRRRQRLSDRCAAHVLGEEREEAKDFQLNVQLHRACGGDADRLCRAVDADEEGAVTACLIGNRAQVSPMCQDELKRWEMERAGDVQLDRPLYHACFKELKDFCADVQPGEGREEECLQDFREADGFSGRCRDMLEARMEREAGDFQLNYGLREYCARDVAELCKEQAAQIALAQGYSADSQVITCLETQRERIADSKCREEVHRQMAHEAEDIRFDHALARACHSDVKELCPQVVPGSARVIHCLQANRTRLKEACSQQLFAHEVMLAEDIDFKYPLRHACVVEIDIFCAGVPHGHARLVRCLQDNAGHDEMSAECRDEVQRDQFASSMDYRLNYRLRRACAADVEAVCKGAKQLCAGRECLGAVLDCLRERQEELRGEECRNEVFKTMQLEASDFRNDHQTREACGKDAAQLCSGVDPSGGRMHLCLRQHLAGLSPKCREREARLTVLQARDVRLQPALLESCPQEMSAFCEDVEPGKGRKQRCLVEAMARSGFGAACRAALTAQLAAAQRDHQLDYGVATSCRVDVAALCSAEAAQQAGAGGGRPGRVLACLVGRYRLLGAPCQAELNRFVRQALWNYGKGGALTRACDADVQARCPAAAKQRPHGPYRPGMVGKCLAKQVVQGHRLAERCRKLVLVAAPSNVRDMFDRSMSLEAVAGKVAQIAHSAGLSATLVDPNARGLHAITVTGWVAGACVAAMVLVVVAMALFAAWRWARAGRQHRYTPVGRDFKQGDV